MIVDHRAAFLDDITDQWKGGDSADAWRLAAWEKFEQIGLPDRKAEAYKYFPAHLLYGNHFARGERSQISIDEIRPFVLPDSQDSCVVFVNGHLDLELSSIEGIEGACIVRVHAEAMRSYGAFIRARLAEVIKEEKDAFSALHQALHDPGAFFYLPARSKIEQPIQILNICLNRVAPTSVMPKVQIFAGKDSEATFIATTHALGEEPLFVHSGYDLVLEEKSRVELLQVVGDEAITWGLSSLRCSVKSGACFDGLQIASGSNQARFDYRVDLVGEEASTSLKGAGLCSDKRGVHVHVDVRHKAPNTRSSQLFKGAVKSGGLSAFEGKIFVDPIAQQTDAFQLCKHLLLDESAKAFAKPNLEIYADDVKASHGATFGPLEEEPAFYAETRGLDRDTIEQFLIRAFFKDVEEGICCEQIQYLFQRCLELFCVSD